MIISKVRGLVAAAAVLGMTGCGTLGTLATVGDVLGTVLGQPAGAGGQAQAYVEIRGVDARQQVIQVRTEDGRTGNVRYDANTQVVYRQQQYPVTALERGDLAVMTVQEAQGGTYVSRVDVQQSARAQAGVGHAGSLVALSGRIAQIDHNGGVFVLQTQGGNVTVTLPYNPPQATRSYFNQLRVGHNISVEVVPVATGRAEVHRFL
jgi:hypothetical protein